MRRMKTQNEKLPTGFAELVRQFPPQAIHDEVGYANMQEMIDRLTSLPKLTVGQTEYLETLTILSMRRKTISVKAAWSFVAMVIIFVMLGGVGHLVGRLAVLLDLGLGYLSLERSTPTLSPEARSGK